MNCTVGGTLLYAENDTMNTMLLSLGLAVLVIHVTWMGQCYYLIGK